MDLVYGANSRDTEPQSGFPVNVISIIVSVDLGIPVPQANSMTDVVSSLKGYAFRIAAATLSLQELISNTRVSAMNVTFVHVL